MTDEDKELLKTIQEYADKVMPDSDPQQVMVSEQIKLLRPILQEMAMKYKTDVEDIFIRYMDLSTKQAVAYNKMVSDEFKGLNS